MMVPVNLDALSFEFLQILEFAHVVGKRTAVDGELGKGRSKDNPGLNYWLFLMANTV